MNLPRNPGIRARALALALVPSLVIGGVLSIDLIQGKVDDLDESLRDRASATVRLLAPACEYGVASGNLDVLQRLIDQTLIDPDIQGVAVYAAPRTLLAQAGQSLPALLPETRDASRIVAHAYADRLVYFAPISRTYLPVEDFGSVATPRTKTLGWIGVDVSREATRIAQRNAVLNSLAIVFGGVVIALFFAWRIGRGIIRPVLDLTATVRNIGAGHLETRSTVQAGGELQELQRGVNAMADQIALMQGSLQERIDLATARLVYQASHDALTGLINRREFEQRLERALAAGLVQGREHVLCYMDLDQFKVINDTCGHAAGDELLRQLALLLKKNLRVRDSLARLGGDEFALLLENCDLSDALTVAEGIQKEIQRFRFSWQNQIFSVGMSVGVVAVDRASANVDAVLSAADAACYVAKDRGRNQIHVYEARDSDLVRHRGEMHWVTQVHRALEESRLSLMWQEIHRVDGAADSRLHIELLLRMQADDDSLILPMAFIPAAERYAIMPLLDTWVVEQALALGHTLGERAERAERILLGVNLSGVSLKSHDFRQHLLQALANAPEMGPRLCFEITETAAIGNLAVVNAFILAMKEYGCAFALDDFGSGLSSFSYLKNLRVDYLKIDGAFVRELARDPIDRAMVDAIHRVGRQMGIRTVAEFVGDAATLDALKAIGVDYAQGEYIHEPAPLETLAARLALT